MKNAMRWICALVALVMLLSVSACKKQDLPDSVKDSKTYIGTWRGSDHNEDKVVHYLIIDEKGYWNVYMNYTTLVRAIKEMPEQLVSFKIFTKVQNSKLTGCYYEYVEFAAGEMANDVFVMNEETALSLKADDNVQYTKVSDEIGEPGADIVEEARDLFDNAREEALS